MRQFQKRPYKADCVQWTGDNFDEVKDMMKAHDVSLFGGRFIMIRHNVGISTLDIGHWVVRGENGYVKAYADEVFRVKYMEAECHPA